jgi:hypothetical protein
LALVSEPIWQLQFKVGHGSTGRGRRNCFCHSERSEESLFDMVDEKKERFLASLGITKFWWGFFRNL